jgi:hypothetical protein
VTVEWCQELPETRTSMSQAVAMSSAGPMRIGSGSSPMAVQLIVWAEAVPPG